MNCCASHNCIDFKRVNIDIAVHSDQIKCPEYMYECIERTWESFEMFKLFKITMYIQRNYCYRKYIKFIGTRLHVQNYRPLLFGDAFYGYLNVYILNGYCWSSNCNSLLFSWSSSYFGIINKIHYDAGVFYHHEPPNHRDSRTTMKKKCAA